VPFILQKLAGQQSLITLAPGASLRIGRGTNAELRFDDPAVALEHAVIERGEAGYRLIDRGSVTGTYLNGKPVREERLAHGDLINIGGFQIRFQLTHPEDPPFLSVRAIASRQQPAAQAAAQATLAAEIERASAAAAVAGEGEGRAGPVPAGREAAGPAVAARGGAAARPAAGAAAARVGAAAPPAGAARAAAERPPGPPAAALRVPAVDYLKAFGLRRRFFNQALLSVALALAAAALLASLPLTGKTAAFEPGGVHRWHADTTTCASCHAPWRGPDPALCADCHATQREKGEVHQARQTLPPPCGGCHPEHRGSGRVAEVSDRECVICHADLEVKSGEPRFARHVRAFSVPDGHPEFSVTLPSGARLPLADAVARRADPTPLRFNHQRHLRAGLPTPSGRRVQLGCESCHRVEAGGGETGIVPVTYQESCTTSGCHPLTFDERRPDQVAPHAPPQRVREFLVSVYSDRRGGGESVREQYRRLVRGIGAPGGGLDFGAWARGAEVQAERYLYGIACKQCHLIDADARPFPKVTWSPIPARWLPHAVRFSHLDHRTSACLDCHAAAAGSTVAADVLLPSIAACRGCHGGGGGSAGPAAGPLPRAVAARSAGPTRPAPADCISCHTYHPASPASLTAAALR
jgi:FHA domain